MGKLRCQNVHLRSALEGVGFLPIPENHTHLQIPAGVTTKKAYSVRQAAFRALASVCDRHCGCCTTFILPPGDADATFEVALAITVARNRMAR